MNINKGCAQTKNNLATIYHRSPSFSCKWLVPLKRGMRANILSRSTLLKRAAARDDVGFLIKYEKVMLPCEGTSLKQMNGGFPASHPTTRTHIEM